MGTNYVILLSATKQQCLSGKVECGCTTSAKSKVISGNTDIVCCDYYFSSASLQTGFELNGPVLGIRMRTCNGILTFLSMTLAVYVMAS